MFSGAPSVALPSLRSTIDMMGKQDWSISYCMARMFLGINILASKGDTSLFVMI